MIGFLTWILIGAVVAALGIYTGDKMFPEFEFQETPIFFTILLVLFWPLTVAATTVGFVIWVFTRSAITGLYSRVLTRLTKKSIEYKDSKKNRRY